MTLAAAVTAAGGTASAIVPPPRHQMLDRFPDVIERLPGDVLGHVDGVRGAVVGDHLVVGVHRLVPGAVFAVGVASRQGAVQVDPAALEVAAFLGGGGLLGGVL